MTNLVLWTTTIDGSKALGNNWHSYALQVYDINWQTIAETLWWRYIICGLRN